MLRAIGDNHVSAHALGYPVLRIRMMAVMFGGACAGLGGAFLPLAYTPFFIPGMTAGRGWIALALVVFASWRPGRLVAGAYLFGAVTILQLARAGGGLGIPSQLMSSLPYLATVIVLVLISRARGTAGSAAPASLGTGVRAGPLICFRGARGRAARRSTMDVTPDTEWRCMMKKILTAAAAAVLLAGSRAVTLHPPTS